MLLAHALHHARVRHHATRAASSRPHCQTHTRLQMVSHAWLAHTVWHVLHQPWQACMLWVATMTARQILQATRLPLQDAVHLLLQRVCTVVPAAAASCEPIHAATATHHLLAHLGLSARDGQRA
jgi:hypothetical protein